MQIRRQAKIDDVDRRVGEQRVERVIRVDALQIHLLPRRAKVAFDGAPVAGELLGIAGADGPHLGAANTLGRLIMNHPHEADAGDAEVDHVSLVKPSAGRAGKTRI